MRPHQLVLVRKYLVFLAFLVCTLTLCSMTYDCYALLSDIRIVLIRCNFPISVPPITKIWKRCHTFGWHRIKIFYVFFWPLMNNIKYLIMFLIAWTHSFVNYIISKDWYSVITKINSLWEKLYLRFTSLSSSSEFRNNGGRSGVTRNRPLKIFKLK